MQQVFSNDMVTHVWAQQRQDRGRTSNGNIYFEGATLFSYGSHFPLGVIMRGKGVAVLNADSYSITTTAHQSRAAGAVRNLEALRLPSLKSIYRTLESISEGSGRAVPHQVKSLLAYVEENAAALSGPAPLGADVTTAERLAEVTGIAKPRAAAALKRGLAKAEKAKLAREKADRERRAVEAKQVAELDQGAFEKWAQDRHWVKVPEGPSDSYAMDRNREFATYLFRLHRDGKALKIGARRLETLATSHGADVPWSHAVKAFRFIRLCRETRQPFHANGRVVRVGHFTVTSIDADGNMQAGCHTFAWADMKALAEKEGAWLPGSDEAVTYREGAAA